MEKYLMNGMENAKFKRMMLLSVFIFAMGAGMMNAATASPSPETTEPQQSNIRITGTVVDQPGEPVVGANVVEKGVATNGTITDVDGHFSLSVSQGATLAVSCIGFVTQEVSVKGQSRIDVILQTDIVALDEVVAIGYGIIRRSDLTGAIATLGSKDINTNVETKVIDAIQGKVAGLSIESLGGEPGSDMRIQIRGAGSLSNNNPLVLIDGVPGSMDMLNTNNIKSMQVLKDASASAIYGARAANGVILVETTGGRKGDVVFSANVDYGIQQLAEKMNLLNAEEWRRVNTDARAAAGLPPADFLSDYLGELPVEGTDWQEAMYVTAPIQKYNLSASGGTENVNYHFAAGYLNQDGIVQTTKFNQLNLQVKTDYTKGKFKMGESLIVTKEFKKNTPEDGGGRGDVIESAVMANPNIKIYQSDYTPEQLALATTPVGSGGNVIGILNLDRDEYDLYRMFFEAYGEIEFFKGLKYKLNIGSNNSFRHNFYARPIYALQDKYAMGTQMRAQDGEMSESNSTSTYWLIENTLNYQKEFGKHSLNILLGQSAEKSTYRDAGGTVYNLPDGVQVLSAGSRNASVFGSENANTISSLFGRAIYSYDSRYIFTGTVRRDGSSRFSDNNKYGTFPSVALAWNVSNESFLQDRPMVSKLRLRANYGILGNESIGNYQYLGLIQPSFYYTIGNSATNWIGSTQVDYPAVGIKWEETATTNLGLELGLWNDRFNLTFDYFKKTTTDLLLRIPIPYSAGSGSDPYGNAGKIENNGFELLMTYNGKVQDFNFSLTGTFSHIRNEVKELSTTSQQLSGAVASLHGGTPVTYTKVNYPIYSFFVIKTDGLFRSQEEVDAHSKNGELIQKNAKPGDIRFIDYNEDGIIDGNDRQYCGSGFPDFEYGFKIYAEYKGFDMNLFLQGTQGNKIYNAFRTYTESVRAGNNYTKKVLDSYTYDPVNGNYPRLDITDPNGNDIDNSDRYLEDGSYLRLKTFTLGYTFPDRWVHNLSVQRVKVYIGAQNFYTITKYEGYNPDIGGGQYQGSGLGTKGVDYSVYPLPRSYHIGLLFNF
ncbi:MAG: TonB-dependent receptor [Tannerella sp.]|jgi:TonB-linked SusC/RagA family outer membrane protein|nr:TonB-dependent receptor [Tannerella sp.]